VADPDREIDEAASQAGERFEKLVEYALEAEMASGHPEETVEKAKRHILVRVGIVVVGTLVLLVGLALLALPGPGLVVVALGLGLLATEIPFAARLLERIKGRLPHDESGKIPRSAIVMMVVVGVIATGASIAWTIFRT
jgi:uncharacterized protein (TIGR02611 family)